MRFDKYTQKAQAAVGETQSLAEQMGHSTIEPEHLLLALLRQEGGVVPAILSKIGASEQAVAQSVERALAAMPRATGASLQLSLIHI